MVSAVVFLFFDSTIYRTIYRTIHRTINSYKELLLFIFENSASSALTEYVDYIKL